MHRAGIGGVFRWTKVDPRLAICHRSIHHVHYHRHYLARHRRFARWVRRGAGPLHGGALHPRRRERQGVRRGLEEAVPPHDRDQQGPPPPRLLRLPLPPLGRPPAPPEARVREDHLPRHVDQHVLLAPALHPVGAHRGGPDGRPQRGHPQARARARHPSRADEARRLHLPHPDTLPCSQQRPVGRARGRLHPVHRARRYAQHQRKRDRRPLLRVQGRARGHVRGPQHQDDALVQAYFPRPSVPLVGPDACQEPCTWLEPRDGRGPP